VHPAGSKEGRERIPLFIGSYLIHNPSNVFSMHVISMQIVRFNNNRRSRTSISCQCTLPVNIIFTNFITLNNYSHLGSRTAVISLTLLTPKHWKGSNMAISSVHRLLKNDPIVKQGSCIREPICWLHFLFYFSILDQEPTRLGIRVLDTLMVPY
jgi:hypothetical protein